MRKGLLSIAAAMLLSIPVQAAALSWGPVGAAGGMFHFGEAPSPWTPQRRSAEPAVGADGAGATKAGSSERKATVRPAGTGATSGGTAVCSCPKP